MELKELQKIELEIVLQVKKICDKHNLIFYLSEGSLLGAVRHHGFIPWDDDMDIMMPREDYEKFLTIALKELPKKYLLQCSKNLPTYWTGSAKIRTTQKTDFLQTQYLHLTNEVGPYIDIFPLDYVPKKTSYLQRIQDKKVRIYKLMLWYKSKLSNPKKFKKKILKFCTLFFTVKDLQKMLYKQMTKFNKKQRNYYVNFGSVYGAKKQTIPIEKYGKPILVSFENYELPIPCGYDYILTKIYKNYMKLPPLNKRKPKHNFGNKNKDNSVNKQRRLQLIELDILKEVDRICKKNHITYYMAEGSLLGTIRHHGFIPWDDDLDIMMLRKDYEKFLEVAPKEINDKYEIQHASTIKKYWSPFIKVRYLNNNEFAQKHIAHLTDHNGPLLDIFPVDNVPEIDSFGQHLQAIKIKLYRGMLGLKLYRKPKKIKSWIVWFLSHFYSVKKLHKNLDKTFKKYNNKNNKYLVNLASYYNYRKQTFPLKYYGKPKYVKFENMKVPVPKEADKILAKIYGNNYMDIPPLEKRVTKHHFED